MDHREHGRIGADAKGQREDGGHGESGVLAHRPQRIKYVPPELLRKSADDHGVTRLPAACSLPVHARPWELLCFRRCQTAYAGSPPSGDTRMTSRIRAWLDETHGAGFELVRHFLGRLFESEM